MAPKSAKADDDPATARVYITLPAGARALLDQLAQEQVFAADTPGVARFLLIQKLDEMVKEGRLKLPQR